MSRQIACILLKANRPLVPADILAALRHRHPDLPVEWITGTVADSLAAGSVMLRCAGVSIIVMTVPMPLPKEEWERPSLRASSQWVDAPSVFASHDAHFVVSTLGDPADRLQSTRSIAAVVGALISDVPGCRAVLWEGLVAHSAEGWMAISREAFSSYPMIPYPLWMSLHPFQDGGKVGVISFGLASFVGREIELEPQDLSPEEVINKVAGLTVYLLQHGPVLNDGDTFGATKAERITVHHAQSKRVPGLAVLQSTAEAA